MPYRSDFGTDYTPPSPRTYTLYDVAAVVLFFITMAAIIFLPTE